MADLIGSENLNILIIEIIKNIRYENIEMAVRLWDLIKVNLNL